METKDFLHPSKQLNFQERKPSRRNFGVSLNQQYQSHRNGTSAFCTVPEQPIDLTISATDLAYINKNEPYIDNLNYKQNIHSPRMEVSENFMPSAFTQAKQLEIIKAAKSLFSKRTRTLYHWMYPNASKQQIKDTVTTSWDSLAETEKAFYISQVLGRFGLSTINLMVNPQLDTIRELPSPSEMAAPQTKSWELENAISSITPEMATSQSNISFEQFEAINEQSKKRRGRPKGGNLMNKKPKSSEGDFQDDPELSHELEKFAVKFNINSFVK